MNAPLGFMIDWESLPRTVQAMIDFKQWISEDEFTARAKEAERLDAIAEITWPNVYGGKARDRYLEKVISGHIPIGGTPTKHLSILAPLSRDQWKVAAWRRGWWM